MMASQRTPNQRGFGALLKQHLKDHNQPIEDFASCIDNCLSRINERSPLAMKRIVEVIEAAIEREEQLLWDKPFLLGQFWTCGIFTCLKDAEPPFQSLLWAKLGEL
jgi:hypothetical protein